MNNKLTEDELFEYYQNDLNEDFKLDKSKVVKKFTDLTTEDDLNNNIMRIEVKINV